MKKLFMLLFYLSVFSAGQVSAQFGKSLQLNGSTDYVQIGSMGAMPNQGSITFWMKTNIIGGHPNAMTTGDLTGCSNGNNGIRFEQGFNVFGSAVAGAGTGCSVNGGAFTSSLQAGVPYHIAFVWDKNVNEFKGYLNGNLAYTVSNTSWPANFQDVKLGVGWDASRLWNGELDEVTFWDKQLNAAEILNVKNKSFNSNDANLVAYYTFDNNNTNGSSQTIVNERNPGTYNGTTVGTAGTPSFAASFISFNPPGNNSVYFDGTNGASTPYGLLNGSTNFTMEFWMNSTDTRSDATYYNRPSILTNISAGLSSGDLGIYLNSGFIGMYHGLHSSGDLDAPTTAFVADGLWHHVAVTDNSSVMTLYVDGSAVATLNTNLAIISSSPSSFQLSGHTFNSGILKAIASVTGLRFSNSVRYTSNFVPPSSAFVTDANTVALYPLDNCTTGMTDQSANANNGSFSGTCIAVTDGGLIGSDQTFCSAPYTPALLTNLAPAFGGKTVSYQWQDSVTSGTWTDISGANSATYQPAAVSVTTYYRRKATYSSTDGYSNTVTILSQAAGNPAVFGSNEWNIYAYNGRDIDLGAANVSYRGYYTVNALNVNTTSQWGSTLSPSSAAGYQGCSVNTDNFTWVMKRQGFPTDSYVMSIGNHDDEIRVYIDGVQVFEHLSCCDAHNNISIGGLDANSTVEVRTADGAFGAETNISFVATPVQAGVIGSATTVCSGTSVALTSVSGTYGGYIPSVYQWQDSIASGTWTNISGATNAAYTTPALAQSTWYRRMVTDNAANIAYSNTVAITVNTVAGDTSVSGTGQWNYYVFNGNSVNLSSVTYAGYYTNSSLDINTSNDWNSSFNPSVAANYQGCPVSNDDFTIVAKRKGFTPDSYVFHLINHDDDIQIYKNNTLVYAAGCCNTSGYISLGTLGANDSLQVRLTDNFSSSFLNMPLFAQALYAGTVTGSESLCNSEIPSAISNTQVAYGGATGTFTYQWQDSTASGIWQDIAGATSTGYTPGSLSESTWYRRKVLDGADSAFTAVISKTVNNNAGDTSLFPYYSWNVYGYGGASLNVSSLPYFGFYNSAVLNLNTQNDWSTAASPSSASGYQGCPMPSDNFSFAAKRKGFAADNYILNILNNDDQIRIYKDNVQIFEFLSCCGPHNNISLGAMDDSTTIEIRIVEFGGGASVVTEFVAANLHAGTIAGDQTICASLTPSSITNTQSAYGGPNPGGITYQWQDSLASGTWNNISGATNLSYTPGAITATTYYRRQATDGTSTDNSNVVTLTYLPTYVWTGAINTSWTNSANWSCNVVPDATTDVTIPAGAANYPVLTANASVKGLALNSGAALAINSGVNLSAKGNVTNNITLSGAGALVMDGTTAQTLAGSGTLQNLEIANNAGVTLSTGSSQTMIDALTLTTGQFTLNGGLTLSSTASGTARLAAVAGGTITGDVTVERYIPAKRAWRFLTAPVNSTTTIYENWQENGTAISGYGSYIFGPSGSSNGLDISGAHSMYTYGVAPSQWNAVTSTNQPADLFRAGTGYRFFTRGDRMIPIGSINAANSTTLRASGSLLTGNVTFAGGSATPSHGTLPPLNNNTGGFTLIGNPYASPVDIEAVMANGSTTNMNTNYYWVWDAQLNGTNGRGRYVVYDLGTHSNNGGASQADQHVQSGEAIFVQTTGPNPSLAFTENNKTSQIRSVFKTTTVAAKLQVKLYVDDSVLTDAVAVKFDNSFSPSVSYEDATKLNNLDENLSIYRNGSNLAIEARPEVVTADTIPLNVWQLANNGNYKLELTGDNLPAGVGAYLKDNYLNQVTPLNANGPVNVSFSAQTNVPASYGSNRFVILFGANPLELQQLDLSATQQEGSKVRLDWTAERDEDVSHYQVEKSAKGTVFETVISVAGDGAGRYQWLDEKAVNGSNYYRIKAVKNNGQSFYSNVVVIRLGARDHATIAVYPNPATSNICQLQLNNVGKGELVLKLYNNTGQLMSQQAISHPGGSASFTLHLPGNLANGTYKLTVTGPDNSFTETVILNK